MLNKRRQKIVAAALTAALLLALLSGCGKLGSNPVEEVLAASEPTATAAPVSAPETAPETAPEPTPEPTAEPLPRYADHEESMEVPAGPLVINEVKLADGDSVEIKNRSSQTVRLSDYYLSDKNLNRLKLQLPDVTLEPGGLYVTDELPLSVKGERLWLSDAEETVLDYAKVSGLPVCGSYGRMDGQDGWFYFTEPSLGEDNHDGFRRVSDEPLSNIPSGPYDAVDDGLYVELSGSGTIYYTLDGQKPDEDCAVYKEPIHLTETTALRAYVVEEGAIPSRVATFNYFINEYDKLPIIAFSADDYGAWYSHYHSGNRFGEYAGTAAYYQGKQEIFNLDCGLRLKGFSAVMDEMKKNFGFYFRGRYGDGHLENCDLFGTGITEYSSLLIRAGQDHHEALIRNEVMQELCLEATDKVPAQHNIYCAVYMNGHYKGIYSIKENMNEHFFADVYGVSPESVTTLRVRADVEACEELQEIFDLGENADMTDPANYARFCELFDIDNFIDWILLEGFSGNTDLLENVRYFKSPEIDQRWRFAFFDLDCAFYEFHGGMRCIFESYSRPSYEVTFMSRNLIRNPEFRDKLLSRYAEWLRGPLSPENVMATIDRLAAEIEPDIDKDRRSNGIERSYWDQMMELLRRFGTEEYTRATIDALRQDLEMSQEEVNRYFPEWT